MHRASYFCFLVSAVIAPEYGCTGNVGANNPPPSDPCAGVTCSGHGTCVVASGAALCACDRDYHADALSCVADVAGNAPVVTLSANPTTVDSGGTSTLTWSSTNATACTASGAWSGAKATSGNEVVGPIDATSTLTLTCDGPGGSASRSTTVYVPGTGLVLYEQRFTAEGDYGHLVVLTEGATHTHLPAGGWDGTGAAQFHLADVPPTSSSQYAGIQYWDLPEASWQSDTMHYRWVCKFGPNVFEKMTEGSKLLITHRADVVEPPNPRIMVLMSQYAGPGTAQMWSNNNIDNGPPNPPLYTLEDKADQWISYELGVSLSQNSRRLWATVQGGTEVLIHEEPLNRTDGRWTGGTEFGFWGDFTSPDAETYWVLDDYVISNQKIGPPVGF